MSLLASPLAARTAAVVPCYNVQDQVGRVLEGILRYLPPERVIVVDDGSTDSTRERAQVRGVQVVEHHRNLGKGAALVSGARRAEEMGMEYVVTLDADGQHDPDEIPLFLSEVERSGADIVIGNRMGNPEGMPPLRKLSNLLTSLVISLRTGCRIPDSQSGYRMIRVSLLTRIPLVTRRYETESEVLIKAARQGAVIASVPIRTIYGTGKSSIHPVRDTIRFFSLVVRSFFW